MRLSLLLGRTVSTTEYINSQRFRTRAINIMKKLFETVDIIATPTSARTAPRIRDTKYGESDLQSTSLVMRYAFLGNLTGVPAISFPAGYDSNGLPIGMQLTAKWWEEALLLRVARCAEQFVEKQKPQVHHTFI